MKGSRWHVPLLVLLGLPVFFWGLGSYGVVNGDEGLYHTVAVLMVEHGDWMRLDFFEEHRVYDTFMNSPTHYWMRATLITLFGDNLWTMRVLTATFGLLCVLATYRLVLAIGGERLRNAALVAALALMTSFQFVWLHGARTGELDMFVTFLIVGAAIGFLRAVRDGESFVVHHVCLAFLLTTKLPLSIGPVAGELLFFAVTPSARRHFWRYVGSGFAIVSFGLAWHVWQAISLGEDFLEVVSEMRDHASGHELKGPRKGTPLENVGFYAELVLVGAFPWSIAMLPALARSVRIAARAPEGGDARSEASSEVLGWRVALCILAGVVLFFVVVSKRFPWYILPAYPFLLACVGAWLFGRVRQSERGARWPLLATFAGAIAIALWLDVDLLVNPFEERAPLVAIEAGWRDAAPVGVAVALVVSFAIALLGLYLLARRRSARPWVLPLLVAAPCVVVGAVRVVHPLTLLPYWSELHRIHERLDRQRRAGRPVAYPVVLPEAQGYLKVYTYFGRHFRIKRGPGGGEYPKLEVIDEMHYSEKRRR